MNNSFSRRGIRAVALVFLTLTATLAGAGCGKDGGSDLTSPPPSDPGPSDPGPSDPGPGGWTGPDPVGYVMYAVDLGNTFYVFGSESFSVLTAKMKITGLPILKRIIGIAVRPSNGKLYGVGNDSRVYTIDPYTAVATPVSSGPFTPKIADIFDIHFAMDLEPSGDRVRLIAAESGANWSISLDDGTATTGEASRYATGTELEGHTPRLLGMYYAPPADPSDPNVCQNLAYAIDADEAMMIAACDPATGEWWPTVVGEPPQGSVVSGSTANLLQASSSSNPQEELEKLKDQILRCGEALPSPGAPGGPDGPGGGSGPGQPRPQEGGPWFPRTPDTPTYLFLVDYGQNSTSLALAEAAGLTLGVTPRGKVPVDEPIQTAEWAGHGISHPPPMHSAGSHDLELEAHLSVAGAAESVVSTPPAPQNDPRARCTR
jgi:Domain of unknown function (DUF4394)